MPANMNRTAPWLLLWIVLTMTSLVSRPPLPIDETRYLSVAWEMWHTHQFLVPCINGQPYSHKPPLLFWIIDFGWWLCGVNSWSARLVAPLFGLASVFVTKRIACVLWPSRPRIGALAPFFLLGMPVWSFFSSMTMFDTLVTFFALLSWLVLLTWHDRKPSVNRMILGLIIGLGLLAKGPVLLVFLLWPMVLAPWWMTSKPVRWKSWYGEMAISLATGLLLALCWAWPAALAGGNEYGNALLYGQTAGRLVQSFAHQRPVYWYGVLLPLLLFPWSCWPFFWRQWRMDLTEKPLRFCLSILLPALCTLSIVSGKQVHYLLPLMPIFALIVARFSAEEIRHWLPRDRWVPVLGLGVLAIALLLLPHLSLQGNDAALCNAIPSWLGLIPACLSLLWFLFFPRNPCNRTRLFATCMVFLLIALHLALRTPLHQLLTIAPLTAALAAVERHGHQIAVFPPRLKDQFHFAARLNKPLLPFKNTEAVTWWSTNNPQSFCLLFFQEPLTTTLKNQALWQRYKEGWLVLIQAARLQSDAMTATYSLELPLIAADQCPSGDAFQERVSNTAPLLTR